MKPEDKTGISILFVDDEKLIRNSFARELRAEGFTVTAVASGGEAIEMMGIEKYDLVVTDLMMPGIDGFGVLKATKERVPQTAVIIFTSYDDGQFVTEALRLGADDFTVKPCEVEELVCRIRNCLEKRGQIKIPASEGR
jgi:DNA-binding response OmpR family regulator